MGAHGVSFAAPQLDLDGCAAGRTASSSSLTGGLTGLAKQRKVTVVQGDGKFISLNQLRGGGAGRARKTVQLREGDHRRRAPSL